MSAIEDDSAVRVRVVRTRGTRRNTRPLGLFEVPQASVPHPDANPTAELSGVSATTQGASVGVKAANRVIFAALGLGGSVDILFYGKGTGISMLIFVGLVLAAIFWTAWSEGVRPAWRNLWLVAPLLFFATMVAVRASTTLTLLNISTTLILLCMVVGFFVEGKIEQLGLLGYPVAVARTIKGMLSRPAPLASSLKQSASANHSFNRRALEIVRGALIALPLLALFTLLLSSADTIFEGYVTNVLQLHFLDDLPEIMLRIGIILASSWLAAGALLIVAGKRNNLTGSSAGATGRLFAKGRGLGFVEAAVVLGLVNALFAVFAWIQFAVLFSGQAAHTMGFEEYRDYVRRGFGELLAVGVLTMILILGLRRAMRQITEGQERTLKLLNSVMIALALVMLVSAFERMVVWESIEFYINTATRIFVRTFIVWLGLLFVWLFFTSWFRRDRFAVGALAAAVGFLATINMINPDADVAAYNIRRNDELSTRYLYLLSEDAVPALVAGLDTTTGQAHEMLRINLEHRFVNMAEDDSWQQWPAINFSRQQAYSALVKLRDEGKIFR
jgi:hypothetical protein